MEVHEGHPCIYYGEGGEAGTAPGIAPWVQVYSVNLLLGCIYCKLGIISLK